MKRHARLIDKKNIKKLERVCSRYLKTPGLAAVLAISETMTSTCCNASKVDIFENRLPIDKMRSFVGVMIENPIHV